MVWTVKARTAPTFNGAFSLRPPSPRISLNVEIICTVPGFRARGQVTTSQRAGSSYRNVQQEFRIVGQFAAKLHGAKIGIKFEDDVLCAARHIKIPGIAERHA
jgi:hypothetical protein